MEKDLYSTIQTQAEPVVAGKVFLYNNLPK
jgi:hypothetical protein